MLGRHIRSNDRIFSLWMEEVSGSGRDRTLPLILEVSLHLLLVKGILLIIFFLIKHIFEQQMRYFLNNI